VLSHPADRFQEFLHRDMDRRRLVMRQIGQLETARIEYLKHTPRCELAAIVRLLAQGKSISFETADTPVQAKLERGITGRRGANG